VVNTFEQIFGSDKSEHLMAVAHTSGVFAVAGPLLLLLLVDYLIVELLP
jgi:hypothetical protein